jgi:hypothetical protein
MAATLRSEIVSSRGIFARCFASSELTVEAEGTRGCCAWIMELRTWFDDLAMPLKKIKGRKMRSISSAPYVCLFIAGQGPAHPRGRGGQAVLCGKGRCAEATLSLLSLTQGVELKLI